MIQINKVKKILEITNLLTQKHNTQELLQFIINNATQVIEAEAASLLLLDETKENLNFYIALGEKGEEVKKQFALKTGQGIAGWVALYGKGLIVNEPEKDQRFFSNISKKVDFKNRNLLCAPMISNGETIGVIELINKIDGDFLEEDLAILEAFSNQCASLLVNTQKISELENKNFVLSNQLEKFKSKRKIIGVSQLIKEKVRLTNMVSTSDSTVLLHGESGTGKELFAELIHNNSTRSNKTFIKVNCAAIPETLIESEFFGYKKGAFTGATKDTPGKIELANKGTIFLDEIGELPLQLQAKLLRFLESKEIQKIGDELPKKVDVRIIAATNRDLPKEISNGNFREDLYYRLNVFPIYLPPLRERKDDIEVLAKHFMKKYTIEMNKRIEGISHSAMNLLREYSWPGNVRELENVIERACVLAQEKIIKKENLYLKSSPQETSGGDLFSEKPLKEAINSFKKEYIVSVLNKHSWKQINAAKVLEIQRTYLSRLIKELDINKY